MLERCLQFFLLKIDLTEQMRVDCESCADFDNEKARKEQIKHKQPAEKRHLKLSHSLKEKTFLKKMEGIQIV